MKKQDIDKIITLYEPKGRDMFLDYPELKEYEEFENLTAREIRFCWLVGNRTSPIIKIPKSERVKKALKMVYGMDSINRKKELQEIYDGKLPTKILKGIARMASFNPSIRFRAKLVNEYIFDKWQEIAYSQDVGEMDADDLKKYTDITSKIINEMPNIIKKIEEGYGIKADIKSHRNEIKVSIDDIEEELKE